MGKIITTGNKREATDIAIKWLKEYGAKVEDYMEISIIELPDNAVVDHISQTVRSYSIDFPTNKKEICVMVTLDVNARDTELELVTLMEEDEEPPVDLVVEMMEKIESPDYNELGEDEPLYVHPDDRPITSLQGPEVSAKTVDLIYEALLETFREVREPGKNALVIPLATYAPAIDTGVYTLREAILQLHQQKRIDARKLNYPSSYPESWEIIFVNEKRQ